MVRCTRFEPTTRGSESECTVLPSTHYTTKVFKYMHMRVNQRQTLCSDFDFCALCRVIMYTRHMVFLLPIVRVKNVMSLLCLKPHPKVPYAPRHLHALSRLGSQMPQLVLLVLPRARGHDSSTASATSFSAYSSIL